MTSVGHCRPPNISRYVLPSFACTIVLGYLVVARHPNRLLHNNLLILFKRLSVMCSATPHGCLAFHQHPSFWTAIIEFRHVLAFVLSLGDTAGTSACILDLSFSMSIFRILVNKLTDATPYSSPTPRSVSTPISPIFSNPGTSTIDNFTRTICGYVPSPTVSRPASFIGNLPGPATF